MANPRVRPHLEFFPVDAKGYTSDAIHGSRWLHELDPDLLSPVIRHSGQEFFVLEPAATVRQEIYMPFRWFRRSGEMFAKAWAMAPTENNGDVGWLIRKDTVLEVPISDFTSSFPFLIHTAQSRGIPDPRNILGQLEKDEKGNCTVSSWTQTDPSKGNRWRSLAEGHDVLAFPIWLYCDDTSGNSRDRKSVV